jgi:hypothetical protein
VLEFDSFFAFSIAYLLSVGSTQQVQRPPSEGQTLYMDCVTVMVHETVACSVLSDTRKSMLWSFLALM